MTVPWTLYTLGNGDLIAAVLLGLQALTRSTTFHCILAIVVLLGLAYFLLSHINKGGLPLFTSIKYLLFIAVLVRVVLISNITIGLVDIVEPQNNRILTNIPFLLGAPAALLSQFGHHLAAEMDTLYSRISGLPNELTMTGGEASEQGAGRYNIIAHLIKAGMHYRIKDPYLKDSLTYFLVDCVTPLIGQGKIHLKNLLTSTDIWGLITNHTMNPALMTVYFGTKDHIAASGRGVVNTCSQVYQKIDADLKHNKADFVKNFGASVNIGATTTLFQTALAYSARQTNYAPLPGHYLQQAALLNIIKNPLLSLMATRTQSASLSKQMAQAQLEASTETRWKSTAYIFQETFGYLFAVLQIVAYALFPMIFLLALLPSLGSALLKNYLQLLIWFPLTFVLLALVSDVIACWTHLYFQKTGGEYQGFSLQGARFLSERADKMISVGGWLMTFIPLLSWGLVNRSQNVFQGMLGQWVSNNALNQATWTATTGNTKLNEQHYDTVEANRFSNVWQMDLGAMPIHSHAATTQTWSSAHLGGLEVTSGGSEAMQNLVETVRSTHSQTSTHYQKNSDQTASETEHQLSTLNREQMDAAHHTLKNITTQIEGNTLGGLAAFAIQKYLQKHPSTLHTNLEVENAAAPIQAAALSSTQAIHSQRIGNAHEHAHYLNQAKQNLTEAFHYLQDQFGHNKAGLLEAAGVMISGLTGVGLGISTLAPEGAVGLMGAGIATGVGTLARYLGESASGLLTKAGLETTEIQSIAQAGIASAGVEMSGIGAHFMETLGTSLSGKGALSTEFSTQTDHIKAKANALHQSTSNTHTTQQGQDHISRSVTEKTQTKTTHYHTPDQRYYKIFGDSKTTNLKE